MTPPPTPAIRITPLPPGGALDITLEPGPAWPDDHPLSADVDRVWIDMCRRNSRLHDGPLLAVTQLDAPAGRIVCGRALYKPFAVQPEIATGLRLLSVNGMLTHHAPDGTTHVLLAQRAPTTRDYPGLWEFVPAGGIDPADASDGIINDTVIRAALIREGTEELGISLADAAMTTVALCEDHDASSVDIIVRVDLDHMPEAANDRWEVTRHGWFDLSDLGDIHLSPPAAAMLRLLGA